MEKLDQWLLKRILNTCTSTPKKAKEANTLFLIHPKQLPNNKKSTYLRIGKIFWPQKEDLYPVQLTVSVNLINYQGENYTPTSDLTISNLLLNSVIPVNGACFVCIDLSNSYLFTPFNNKSYYEYVCIPEWVIPEDIMEEYNSKPLIKNGRVLAEYRTYIYGLPQVRRFYLKKLV